MKRLMLCAALALTSIPGFAQGSDCDVIGVLARSVMGARQSGVALDKMIEIADGEPRTKELMTRVVMAAYERPQYRTETMKQQEIVTFSNDMMLACYKGSQRKR